MMLLLLAQCTVLGLASWLVGAALLVGRPAYRYGLYSAALAAMLILAPLDMIAGASHLALLKIPISTRQPATPRIAPRAFVASRAPQFLPTSLAVSSKPPNQVSQTQGGAVAATASSAQKAMQSAQNPVNSPFPIVAVLVAAYLLGIVFTLGRFWAGSVRLRSIRNSAVVTDDGLTGEAAQIVKGKLGVRKFPVVLVSDRITSPLAVAGPNPAIVIPAGLCESMSLEELVSVLLHEYAHIDQNHARSVLLAAISKALYWPHPFVHLLAFELVRAREEVSDNYVLSMVSAPRFARTLLRVAEACKAQDSYPAAAGLLLPKWNLEQRVAGLLDPKRKSETQMTKFKSTALNVGAGLFCLSMAGVQLAQAQDSTVVIRHGNKVYVLHSTKKHPVTVKVLTSENGKTVSHTVIPQARHSRRAAVNVQYYNLDRPAIATIQSAPVRIRQEVSPASVAPARSQTAVVGPDVHGVATFRAVAGVGIPTAEAPTASSGVAILGAAAPSAPLSISPDHAPTAAGSAIILTPTTPPQITSDAAATVHAPAGVQRIVMTPTLSRSGTPDAYRIVSVAPLIGVSPAQQNTYVTLTPVRPPQIELASPAVVGNNVMAFALAPSVVKAGSGELHVVYGLPQNSATLLSTSNSKSTRELLLEAKAQALKEGHKDVAEKIEHLLSNLKNSKN